MAALPEMPHPAPLVLMPHPGLPGPHALHVLHPKARISLAEGQVLVERPDHPDTRLRLGDLTSLSIHGPASITTPCVQALLEAGVPLLWRSLSGYYLGQTTDLSSGSSRWRRAQYAAQDRPLGLLIARRLVAAKIANMRAALRRRTDVLGAAGITALARLDQASAATPFAETLDSLRGQEGAATAAYFGCWPELARPRGGLARFTTRSRRPPANGVNALLSYCAALVTGECAAALLARGLDLSEGFLHVARAGRPALALDLVEPFRPALADALALALLNTGEIGAAELEERDGFGRLNASGRKLAINALERKLSTAAPRGEGAGQDWRGAIAAAARSLAQVLASGEVERLVLPVQR